MERQGTFELDRAEWRVRGGRPRWLNWEFQGLPPDAAAKWVEHNQAGYEVFEAVSRGEPITLRQVCYLAGHFTAVHQRTGRCIPSEELTRQLGRHRRRL